MTLPGDWDSKSVIRRVGAGLLCLALVACAVPKPPSAPAPTVQPTLTRKLTPTSGSTASPTPTLQPTASATPQDPFTPGISVAGARSGFDGCWDLETEEVSFEVHFVQEDTNVLGTFLLVKMCVVADELTACRIREGSLQGSIVSAQLAEVRILIPEYDDEGTARIELTADGTELVWEEIDYPTLGLADGTSHYLPPSFVMAPCID